MAREIAATLIQLAPLRWLPVAMLLLTVPVQAQIAWQSRLHANHSPPRPSVSRGALAPLAQTPPTGRHDILLQVAATVSLRGQVLCGTSIGRRLP
jgi:hypothetical protein